MTKPAPDFVPGCRGIEHIGITVPDVEAAVAFFETVFGFERIYDLGPFRSEGSWMRDQLNVREDAVMRKLVFMRGANGPNLEIFEYQVADQKTEAPLNSDVGGHHLAFYVDDFDDALACLKRHGVRILGEPVVRKDGPSAGQTWVYFLAPWGLQMEMVSFPQGKAYEAGASRQLWHPAPL